MIIKKNEPSEKGKEIVTKKNSCSIKLEKTGTGQLELYIHVQLLNSQMRNAILLIRDDNFVGIATLQDLKNVEEFSNQREQDEYRINRFYIPVETKKEAKEKTKEILAEIEKLIKEYDLIEEEEGYYEFFHERKEILEKKEKERTKRMKKKLTT